MVLDQLSGLLGFKTLHWLKKQPLAHTSVTACFNFLLIRMACSEDQANGRATLEVPNGWAAVMVTVLRHGLSSPLP